MLCTNSESSFQALQSELDETSDPWVTPHHHVVSPPSRALSVEGGDENAVFQALGEGCGARKPDEARGVVDNVIGRRVELPWQLSLLCAADEGVREWSRAGACVRDEAAGAGLNAAAHHQWHQLPFASHHRPFALARSESRRR